MEDLFSNPLWVNIVNAVLIIVAAVFGTQWAIAKTKFGKAIAFGKTLYDAAKDNRIDQEEVKEIKEAWNDLVGSDPTKKVK